MSTKIDIIGDKLNIPTDIVTIIKEYYYDRRGYSIEEQYFIEKIKKMRSMERIIVELWVWKKLNVSVCWMNTCSRQKKNIKLFKKMIHSRVGRMKTTYHTGCYCCIEDEIMAIREAKTIGIIKDRRNT